jgi:uncharacterized protein YsxB (DUF464 family)
MSENKNLELWNKVDETDPKYKKEVTNSGRTYSSIDAQSQYLKATEQFGPYGSKWGLKNMDVIHHTIGDTVLANIKAVFYYPGGEFETINSVKVAYKTNGYQGKEGYLKVDDEAYKKLETNTVTKALSRLGFNADVFLGMFEDNNYVQEMNYAYADIQGKKIDSEKIREIQALLKATNTNLASLLQNYQVNHLGHLNETQYLDIKQKLGGNKK